MRLQLDDVAIDVESSGSSGPDLLLVHGLGGSRRTWDRVVPLLAAKARVHVPELRGCGNSERGSGVWTLERAATDLEEVVRALGIGKVIAVGHSLGGVLVEDLLARRSDVLDGAVLISTSSRVGEKATDNWLRIADSVEARGLSDSPAAQARGYSEAFVEAHPEIVREFGTISAATDRHVYAQQARAASRYDYTDALAEAPCPVLVLQGLADRLTPPGGSVLLQRALPPGTRLEMLEGAGHNIPIEMPERLAELVLEFAQDNAA
jgi:3-oxoadipate enol-lactonase